MFLRKKANKSGVISVHVIDKSQGRYRVAQTIGSSSDSSEIARLMTEGEAWIRSAKGQIQLDFSDGRARARAFLDNITQVKVVGVGLLLGKLFDEVGFGAIPDALFRQLVLARLSYPSSKLRTTDQLSKYEHLEVDVQTVYRYLDKLHKNQKEQIQQISFEHTQGLLGAKVSLAFYDVTTLHFEAEQEDEFRKTGFSKAGKHQNPQMLLGLLVSAGGYPLAYELFEGNKFEGHTMLPLLRTFCQKHELKKLVVVADSGLLSKENIDGLIDEGHEFILGARLKTEPESTKQAILSLALTSGQSAVVPKANGQRLIVSYSTARAKKDAANRRRGLQKLEAQIARGKLTKANLNNRGYNKFLKMEGDVALSIDLQKLEKDAKWDGLKGYLTNTKLEKDQVIENYGQLWMIEKAFRISKTDLKIRPIYHRAKRRIEAHVCIAFAAYKIYKELERQLLIKKSALSPEKAIAIAKTIYAVQVKLPDSDERIDKTLIIRPEQKNLADLFGF